MNKSFLVLSVFILLSVLTSCGPNFIDMRARVIKDQSIIRLTINEDVAKYYQKGDTVMIERSSYTWDSWKILNDTRRKDSYEYYVGSYYYTNKSKTDSSYVGGYSQEYKNVVIEKIIK